MGNSTARRSLHIHFSTFARAFLSESTVNARSANLLNFVGRHPKSDEIAVVSASALSTRRAMAASRRRTRSAALGGPFFTKAAFWAASSASISALLVSVAMARGGSGRRAWRAASAWRGCSGFEPFTSGKNLVAKLS